MKSELRHPLFSEYAYSGCALVWGALGDYFGGKIFDFIDTEKLKKPSKVTALHDFIDGIFEFVIGETFHDFPEMEIDTHLDVVKKAGLAFPDGLVEQIKSGSSDQESVRLAYGIIMKATSIVEIPSVFNVLFSDKNFIQHFQMEMRRGLVDAAASGGDDSAGKVGRVYLPVWLRRGIFYRDRGRCQLCDKDLSGLFGPGIDFHIDHIVPLADYGNNDPTNFQLTCGGCNLRKAARTVTKRATFVSYWAED